MKKLLFSVLLSMIFFGISVGSGKTLAQTLPEIEVTLAMNKTEYLLGAEAIEIDITMENVGTDTIITSDGFSGEPLHLFSLLQKSEWK